MLENFQIITQKIIDFFFLFKQLNMLNIYCKAQCCSQESKSRKSSVIVSQKGRLSM